MRNIRVTVTVIALAGCTSISKNPADSGGAASTPTGSSPATGTPTGTTPAGTTPTGTTPTGTTPTASPPTDTLDTGAPDTASTDTGTAPLEPCSSDPTWTVGLLQWSEEASDGYTLFAPDNTGTTYLIDRCGREVHRWERALSPGKSVRLTDDGHLLRTEELGSPVFTGGGGGGRMVLLDWDGTELWRVAHSDETMHQHHDALVLPSGNVLFLAWELRDEAESLAAGRDPALLWFGELWPDTLVEVDPATGDIVWRWAVWDHLVQSRDPAAENFGVIADHPGRVDINRAPHGTPDWTHANSLDYSPELDQVVVSIHGLGEVWVIDHDTTTEAAAGPAGDLLYRWGNPEIYGAPGRRRLYGQHHATWISDPLPGAGDLLVFNNGEGRPEGAFSSVDQLTAPIQPDGSYLRGPDGWGPDALTWTWSDPERFAFSMSSAQRLSSGNTFVCDANRGTILEVTDDGRVVWTYINPLVDGEPLTQGDPVPEGGRAWRNTLFRAVKIPRDHPGLVGRDLTPGETLER
ncbi:MAG: hypothetical protein ACI8PZ_003023 [Myxococcota bacterium]|jgi:hypothetical protein